MTRDESYYANVRQAAQQVWFSLHQLKDAQDQWNALDYGNTLADGTGVNAGVTKDQLGAVVFDTTNAIFVVLAAGSSTNLAKLL